MAWTLGPSQRDRPNRCGVLESLEPAGTAALCTRRRASELTQLTDVAPEGRAGPHRNELLWLPCSRPGSAQLPCWIPKGTPQTFAPRWLLSVTRQSGPQTHLCLFCAGAPCRAVDHHAVPCPPLGRCALDPSLGSVRAQSGLRSRVDNWTGRRPARPSQDRLISLTSISVLPQGCSLPPRPWAYRGALRARHSHRGKPVCEAGPGPSWDFGHGGDACWPPPARSAPHALTAQAVQDANG